MSDKDSLSRTRSKGRGSAVHRKARQRYLGPYGDGTKREMHDDSGDYDFGITRSYRVTGIHSRKCMPLRDKELSDFGRRPVEFKMK